jgi:Zn-dependent protease
MFEMKVFQFLVVIFSIVVHEVSHGFVAEKLGDPTARMLGRLTLNPLKHIDPVGSILLPLRFVLSGSPIFLAWAKPVPYDANNLKNPRIDAGKIAFAGPLSNLIIALIFAALFRAGAGMEQFFAMICLVNIWLAVFNLVPVPPLDGSKVLEALFPRSEGIYRAMRFLEQYGFVILIVLMFTGAFSYLYPIVRVIFGVFTGASLGF